MDGKQLKLYLNQCCKKNGRKSLSPVELDYIKNKISYSQYIDCCYTEYLNNSFRCRSRKN